MSLRTKRVLRSLLFVPGNNERLILRAQREGEDAVILDLEDSVPQNEKEAGRRLVEQSLASFRSSGITTFVRINAKKSGQAIDDVRYTISENLDGIVLPKCDSKEDVVWLAQLLKQYEKAPSGPDQISILPLVETPLGVVNVESIARCGDRIVGVAFGAADLKKELVPGASLKTERSNELAGLASVYARSRISIAAAAADVLCVDSPYFALDDIKGLRAEAESSRSMGYTGKMVIHPTQIAPVNEAFSPARSDLITLERSSPPMKELQRRTTVA
jgi:citrate lyase subunit beta / citryl-CoA lyase